MEEWVHVMPERVRSELQTQGLKKWWVAESVGIHRTTLRRWLDGSIRRISLNHAARLAETLTLPICEIMSFSPD